MTTKLSKTTEDYRAARTLNPSTLQRDDAQQAEEDRGSACGGRVEDAPTPSIEKHS